MFYDTHAHLDRREFEADLPEVVARARAAGISRIISIGTDLESSRRAIGLAERFEGVFAAVGWHPTHVLEAPQDIAPALRELATHAKVVALGETGLDFYRMPSRKDGFTEADERGYKERQVQLFEQHLAVAAELGLNCVIHERESFQQILPVLGKYAGQVRGVFHCFSKDAAGLRRVLELGSIVSFTGILTYKNSQNVRDALAAAPPDAFMFETDSPFLAPVPHRGKRCEPAYVKEIAALAAQIRGCSMDDLSRATCATTEKFFRKLSSPV
jgi:TatD DNase family protein